MLKRSPKKALTMDYIEVPPVPWSTPTSSQWQKHSEVSTKRQGKFDMPDDLGGYGSDDDETYSPTRHMTISSAAKSSSRRTGGRDERGMFPMYDIDKFSHQF
jgi:cohesin loading factor subunit SCC2